MNNNIVSIPDEIRNEFRIDTEGKAFVSIRGAARIADIDHKALIKAFKKTGDFYTSKLAQMLIASRFEPGDFLKQVYQNTQIKSPQVVLITCGLLFVKVTAMRFRRH